MKKILISVLMLCSMIGLTFAQDSNQDVVSWLYSNGLTKYESANSFRPYDSITRGEAAKFMVEYAQMQNISKVKSAQECQFVDITNYDSTLRPYIVQACEYGIFKGSGGKYYPSNNITEGEAIAVVMRVNYGLLNEDINPRYLPYYNKAKNIDLSIGNLNSFKFNNRINRITFGLWTKQSNGSKVDITKEWDGYQQAYDLTTIYEVLNGNTQYCDTGNNPGSYYCRELEKSNPVNAFLQALVEKEYQDAANFMNQQSMLPSVVSSINKSIYYLPYNNGILGFQIRGNGDTSYVLSYITINNNILYVNTSKYALWLSYSDDGPIVFNRENGSNYSPSGAQICKKTNPYYTTSSSNLYSQYIIDYSCINDYLKGVVVGTIDDPDTKARIDAMKKKVDQWSQ